MYERIMVPVDGSPTSDRGLDEALKLAQSDGAQLHVVNVVDESMSPPAVFIPVAVIADYFDALRADGTKALQAAEAAAARSHVNADFTQRASAGRSVSDVILDEAAQWRADVLVMGTHGRRGLNRLLLGSDAERVLRETQVPVLLVRCRD